LVLLENENLKDELKLNEKFLNDVEAKHIQESEKFCSKFFVSLLIIERNNLFK
jgi:hypothetical protein